VLILTWANPHHEQLTEVEKGTVLVSATKVYRCSACSWMKVTLLVDAQIAMLPTRQDKVLLTENEALSISG
jgi:hypothetical protein